MTIAQKGILTNIPGKVLLIQPDDKQCFEGSPAGSHRIEYGDTLSGDGTHRHRSTLQRMLQQFNKFRPRQFFSKNIERP